MARCKYTGRQAVPAQENSRGFRPMYLVAHLWQASSI
jgi:hypothetical protein